MQSELKDALIIFVRNPEKGKVKTRLAKDLGDDKTLQVYEFLLQYTADVCMELHCHRFVFYSNHISMNDVFDDSCFAKYLQEGDDLGERMNNAFEKVFELGHQQISIIGSDCYELESEHISQAFEQLRTHEVVLGPSKDGGYYLLGMNKMIESVFAKKTWGTDTVLQATIDAIQKENLSFTQLELLNDIDTLQDLLETDVLARCNLAP